MIDLSAKEKEILSGLKDFQLATVNRVDDLFRNGYRRVLVADEVGLGKTLVAKGVIAKLSCFYQKNSMKDLFKVVYVCSNQSIAGQNLKKLKVHAGVKVDGLSDTRLSMQHLKIYEQMHDPSIREGFVQLIPLTPGTSFTMTGGCGSVLERALIYAIFRRIYFFKPYLPQLEELMTSYATKSWPYWLDRFEQLVIEVDQKSNGAYLRYMLGKVSDRLETDPELLRLAEKVFTSIKAIGYLKTQKANYLILQFRKMMAEISVEMMDADLVIMDEFQRFPELIKLDEDNETAMLARRFFSPEKEKKHHPYILLLSATPYKLYSTLEEIRENRKDEHYEEFMRVMHFLFEHQADLRQKFNITWKNYSMTLNEASYGDAVLLVARKREAEKCLYKGVCRTERMKVPGASDLIDVETRNGSLKIQEDDILSFVEMDKVLAELGLSGAASVEYIKSAPFIMSFMQHYKLKQKLQDKLKLEPKKLSLLKSQRLWVNRKKVAGYKDLKVNHARYNKLREVALPPQAEKLLWVPPARPYYPLGGPFKNQEGFSKTLVFSAWEMVPRAIAALLSYEAERLTVGELIRKTPKAKHENRSYFAKNRFPAPRIKFAMTNNKPENMNHLCLLYPSASLASLYDPIGGMNRGLNLRKIRIEIRQKIKEQLEQMKFRVQREELRQDERWYYVAPLLMDQKHPEMEAWFQNPVLRNLTEGLDGVDKYEDDKGIISKHLQQLKRLYDEPELLNMGRMPWDLEEVLVNMAIASPAVCALRMLDPGTPGSVDLALQLAKTIVDRFNTQEAIAIVDLSYGKAGEGIHWKNILRYCMDGNLQAVLDEYAHMLLEGYDFSQRDRKERNSVLIKDMIRTLKTHTASYNVDTYQHFSDNIKYSKKISRKERYMRMRSSYAVGFYDTKSEGKSVQRKDNIRLSFNSPFRPFVLATTSIGQEGLDFHYYCRNIVHWNLPGNPIDLEQREGRINRYKCHAIRQNIAYKYGKMSFQSDIWQEMFNQAQKRESNSETSDLVPFWCLPEQENEPQPYKIQRVVPLYPMSRDSARYERLIKILSLYRLSLGQPRQEELIDYLFERGFEGMGELFMNLSPYFKEGQQGKPGIAKENKENEA